MFATYLIAKLRGARLIIDWHNYGYSMLALKHGFKTLDCSFMSTI